MTRGRCYPRSAGIGYGWVVGIYLTVGAIGLLVAVVGAFQ